MTDAVPVELHLDAAVFVAPDLLVLRTYDGGRLGPGCPRLGLGALGAEELVAGLGGEAHFAAPRWIAARRFGYVLNQKLGANDEVFAVGLALDEVREGEGAAWDHRTHVTGTPGSAAVLAQGLHAHAGDLVGFLLDWVIPGRLLLHQDNVTVNENGPAAIDRLF